MLERSIAEALAFRDRLGRQVPLDQNAGDAALDQLHREPNSNRPATHDRDVVCILHAFPLWNGITVCGCARAYASVLLG